jgi:hypothetical protein
MDLSKLSKKLIIISIIYGLYSCFAIKSPLHYYDIFIASALLISVMLMLIALIIINLYNLIIRREIFSFAVFIFCALLPWLLPNITPEEVAFSVHKADYDNVVEMARLNDLEQGGFCQQDYILPKGYEDISRSTCLMVTYEPEFEVIFEPKVPGRFLVYTDNLYNNTFCSGFGNIEKVINNHWYICNEYWN